MSKSAYQTPISKSNINLYPIIYYFLHFAIFFWPSSYNTLFPWIVFYLLKSLYYEWNSIVFSSGFSISISFENLYFGDYISSIIGFSLRIQCRFGEGGFIDRIKNLLISKILKKHANKNYIDNMIFYMEQTIFINLSRWKQ